MKTKNLLNLVGREESYESKKQVQVVSVSLASRWRVLGITMLCLLTLGVGNAWGTDVVFNQANTSIGSYSTSETTVSISGFTFGYKNLTLNTKNTPTGWGSVLVQCKKNASDYGQIYNKTEINNMSNIRIYCQNTPDLTVFTSSSSITSKPGSGGTTLGSATGSETVSYTTNTGGTSTTTMSYWDITPSSGAKYVYICNNNSTATLVYKVVITYSTKTLSSIALKTSATKTAYVAGEDFAPAGIVITATYSDASTEDIDYDSNLAKFSFSPSTSLTAGTTSVTVTYGGKTCTQTIAVYAVTVQAKDEYGDAIAAGGPGAPSRTGASISPAADAGNYKFWKWEISGASLGSVATTKSNTITNPTGAVTVTAKYYLPRTVTWKVNGETWTPSEHSGTDGTSEVKRETTWSALTLPDDPTTSDGCGQKFMGWTPAEIDGSLDKTDDADAISTLEATGLLNSDNKSSKSTSTYKIMNNTTFHAVFADYAE